MTILLRPHHLLCLLTYVGKGYSPDFVANYDRIAARLSTGEEIEVTSGPDDICAPIACDHQEHCHGVSVISRDALAAREIGILLGLEITSGTRLSLTPTTLARLRDAFAQNQIRSACKGCDWADLCSTVSAEGYENARITREEHPCTQDPASAAR